MRKSLVFVFLSAGIFVLLAVLSGCFQGAQFGAPGVTKIAGKVAMPENNCYTLSCTSPQVSEGNVPVPQARVRLEGEGGQVLEAQTDDCGNYEVSGATDSCYILYADVPGGTARVKKGIYPVTSGGITNAGEANYYTTAQVIIYEVAREIYGDLVKCSDIPGFDLTRYPQFVEAVKRALERCQDAQKDQNIRNLARNIAQAYFGAPAGGGGGAAGGGGTAGGGGAGGGGAVVPATYSIAGVVFEDKNGNGMQDSGEAGVSGVTVTLSGAGSGTTTSGSDGSYTFSGLGNGSYTVAISGYVAPYEPTTPTSLNVTIAGGNQTGKNFGLQKRYYIKGCIWVDQNNNGTRDNGEPGQPNVTVKLSKNGQVVQTTTTDGNGCYTFMVTEDGMYVVSIVPPAGYNSDPPPSSITVVIQGNSSSNNDFRLYALTYSIRGKVRDKNTQNGINGAKVSLYNSSWTWIADDTSESNGSYVFTGLVPGTYYVKVNTPYPSGYSDVEPASRTVNVTNADVNDQDFDLIREPARTYSISGYVFKDKKGGKRNVYDPGEGVSGVTVKLNPHFRSSIQWEVVTSSDGYYVFENLPAGAYSVEIPNPPTGFYVKSPNPAYYNITLASNVTDKNFQLAKIQPEPTYSIQGFVIDQATNQKLNNVVVRLLDVSGSVPVLLEEVLTGAGSLSKGEYRFEDLPGGSYRVKVVLPDGYVDSYPNKYEFANLNANQTDKNFLLTKQAYCLKGKVVDSESHPLAGIMVKLRQWNGSSFEPAGTDTTDAQGNYSFCSLPPGKYRVVVPTPQAGYPVVRPERYEKEIVNSSFENLDFVLDCSAQNPCCQEPKITNIEVTPSCACPSGSQPKGKTVAPTCTGCTICQECTLQVKVTAQNATQYKYELYIGDALKATKDYSSNSEVIFTKNDIGPMCENTSFSVRVYAKNDCNQEVWGSQGGTFAGGECQDCCGYDFHSNDQKARWTRVGRGRPGGGSSGEDYKIQVQFHLKGGCPGDTIQVTAKIQQKVDSNWQDYDSKTFSVTANGGGNFETYTDWTDTGLQKTFQSAPDKNKWRVQFIAERDGCSDKATDWITFSQ